MAKSPELTRVSNLSIGSAVTAINNNSDKIEEAFANTLSRDGSTPNQMGADIDLNSNDLLNVSTLDVANIVYQGEALVPETLVISNAMYKAQYDPNNVGGNVFDVVKPVDSRATLKALSVTNFNSVFLKEVGRGGLFKWTLGDFSAQVAADTLEGIYIKSNAVNSSVGVWVRQYDYSPVADWWGAVADYTVGGSGTDSTSAIQCAVNVCDLIGEDKLSFRPRQGKKYLVTSTITGKALLLSGTYGAGIVFKNMSGIGGFTFTGATSVGKAYGAERLEFIAEGANILHAVKGPQNSDQYDTYFTRCHFENNYCHGANRQAAKYAFAWDYTASNWFHIGDGLGGVTINNQIWGAYDIKSDPATQVQDCGIRLECNGATLAVEIGHNKLGCLYSATDIAAKSFFHFFDNDCIGNHIGLRWLVGGTHFNEPKVWHNNFNSQLYGIYAEGPGSLTISDNTIRRHSSGWKLGSTDWSGIYLKGCTDWSVDLNRIQPDESGGVFPGTMSAITIVNCSLGSCIGNFIGVGNDRGVHLDNSTGITFNNTKTAQNAVGDVLFNLVTGTRASSLGNAVYVSSFVGTRLAFDGSINWTSMNVDELMGLSRLPIATTLTIAAGVVTATQSFHTIDTEGAAGTDDLDTINVPSYMAGRPVQLELRAASSARDVVVKDGTGNLRLTADFTLTHSDDWISLVYENSVWKETGRNDNTV